MRRILTSLSIIATLKPNAAWSWRNSSLGDERYGVEGAGGKNRRRTESFVISLLPNNECHGFWLIFKGLSLNLTVSYICKNCVWEQDCTKERPSHKTTALSSHFCFHFCSYISWACVSHMRLPPDWVEIISLSIAKSLIGSIPLLESIPQFVIKQKKLKSFLEVSP